MSFSPISARCKARNSSSAASAKLSSTTHRLTFPTRAFPPDRPASPVRVVGVYDQCKIGRDHCVQINGDVDIPSLSGQRYCMLITTGCQIRRAARCTQAWHQLDRGLCACKATTRPVHP
jgi:hypothetical protein